MSVLSDGSIRRCVGLGILVIKPFEPQNVQGSSYDFTLGGTEPLVLVPGIVVLRDTAEWFEFPDNIQGQVHGRSSIGRLGVLVHLTAGLMDPGFKGTVTLECTIIGSEYTFYPGDRLGQMTFQWLDAPAEEPYHGRYQGQRGPTASRFEHEGQHNA